MTLAREIRFEPRDDGSRMQLRFLLIGPEGATQFLWDVKTSGELHPNGFWEEARVPEGWDVGFHAATPRSWQDANDSRPCDVLPQGRCYYDGSGLQGAELGKRFVTEGVDAVWKELQERYDEWLVKGDPK